MLLIGILERSCTSTIVREIPGIQDCFVASKEGDKELVVSELLVCNSQYDSHQRKLSTNGSNLKGIWSFAAGAAAEGMLHDDDIYSNDIYSILKTYGVEMARAAIIKEMSGVFGVYSIQVDRRHLELIADYMVWLNYRSNTETDLIYLVIDIRGRLQALQPKGYFHSFFTFAKGVIRNNCGLPFGCNIIW